MNKVVNGQKNTKATGYQSVTENKQKIFKLVCNVQNLILNLNLHFCKLMIPRDSRNETNFQI